ncbi:MAG: hypothetical protein U0457_21605 [Candidatus Sericytochromatia bacterium]
MKKNYYLTSCLLLSVTTLVLGCNVIDKSKPNTEKEIVIDLGANNGTEAKININLDKKNFNIKDTTNLSPGFGPNIGSNIPNSELIIKLHRYPNSTAPVSPKQRFETDDNMVYTLPLTNVLVSPTITIKNLNFNKDYYISARLYRNFEPIDLTTLNVSTDGVSSTITTTGSFEFLNLVRGDIIKVGANEYTVASTPTSPYQTVNITTPTVVNTTEQMFLKRNIVSVGNAGINGTGSNGMGLTSNLSGGGTIPAKTYSSGTVEEFIRVSNSGATSIQNDNNTNSQLDIDVQLMKDLPSSITGKGKVTLINQPAVINDLDSFFTARTQDKTVYSALTDDRTTINGASYSDKSGNLLTAIYNNTNNLKLRYYNNSLDSWSDIDATINSNQASGKKDNLTLKSNITNTGGQTIVVWQDNYITAPEDINGRTKVYFKRYNHLNAIQNSPSTFNDVFSNNTKNRFYPSLGLGRDVNSKFAIAWSEDRNAGLAPTSGGFPKDHDTISTPPLSDIYLKLFNSDGSDVASPMGSCSAPNPFKVNGTYGASENALGSYIIMDDSGNFIVSWAYINSGTIKTRFKIFDSTGCPKTSEIDLNAIGDISTTQNIGARYSFFTDGSFIATWVNGSGSYKLKAQRFSPLGQKIGSTIDIDTSVLQKAPSIITTSDNESVIAYVDTDNNIYYVTLSLDNPQSGVILVNSSIKVNTTINHPSAIANESPDLALMEDRTPFPAITGNLYMLWTQSQDPSIPSSQKEVLYKKYSKIKLKNQP